ncbi:MAG: periplasmic heavy metal sensor [Desulfobacterales bacterium]|nr:periplasmic heavy metal sensor [Desulfobacterales bacterium]
MKKSILILMTLALILTSAGLAFAHRGGQDHNCTEGKYHHGKNLTPEQIQAHDNFMKQTADIRQSLAVKIGEYRAIMAAETPDAKAAGQLSGEIAAIREQLRTKAVAAGLPAKWGRGMGMKMGMHRGGDRSGSCYW